MTETEFKKIIDDYCEENQRLKEMIDIKEQKIDDNFIHCCCLKIAEVDK